MIAQTNGHRLAQEQMQERPVSELFQELAQDARNLASLEMELAKGELSEKVAATGKDVGFMAAGGFVAYAGFMAIVAAIILVLAYFIPAWLSALLVGVVVALIGYAVLRKGMNGLKSRNLTPEQTIASLKQNQAWIKEKV